MSFSATSAALEGFRLTRRVPMLLVGMTLVYTAVTVLVFALEWQGIRELLQAMQAFTPDASPSQEEQMALIGLYSRIGAVAALPGFIATVLMQTAIARAVLGAPQSKLGYFQPGRDHVNVMILSLLVWLLFIAASFIGFMVVGFMFGLGAVVGPAFVLIGVVVGLAVVAALVWLSVKVSLSLPITIDRQRVGLKESFVQTKGHFWPLVGMGVLALLLSMLVSILLSLAVAPFTYFTGGLELFMNAEQLTAPVLVALAVWIVMNAFVSAAQMIVLYAPFTAAWKQISGR